MSDNNYLNGLIEVYKNIENIQLITSDKADAIKRQHPELHPFAVVTLKTPFPVFTEFYLSLEFNITGDRFDKIVLVGERPRSLGGSKYDILQVVLEFEHSIPAHPTVVVQAPSEHDRNEFEQLPIPTIGVNYRFIAIIIIGDFKFYFAIATGSYPKAPSYPFIYGVHKGGKKAVEFAEASWTEWTSCKKLFPYSWREYVKYIPSIPGETYMPICYRREANNGLNVEFIGESFYKGIGQTTTIVLDRLRFDSIGNFQGHERVIQYTTPTYY